MTGERHEVVRGAPPRVHVLAARCTTCIFRAGNLMRLDPGRRDGMVAEAVQAQGCIPCHSTIRRDDVAPAICRGFYDRHADEVWMLRLARTMDAIVFDERPPE